jgi:hypothetical protein
VLELVDLAFESAGIGGIAGKHLDRDRTALLSAQHAKDDLPLVVAVVAAVAVLGQWAAAAFQIGRAQVVQHQGAGGEVTARQGGFDPALLPPEPVERAVNLFGRDPAETEHGTQRVACRRRIEGAGGGQLGGRFEQAGDDQGQRHITTTLRPVPRQQAIEPDAAGGFQCCHNMAMRQRLLDRHPLTGRDQLVAAQHRAQQRDALGRPVGQVLQSAGLDPAVLAIALTQQNGGRRAAIGYGSDVHATLRIASLLIVNRKMSSNMPTIPTRDSAKSS